MQGNTVRRFRTGDAPAVSALIRAAILATSPDDYTPDQIAAWTARVAPPEQVTKRCADGRTTLVAIGANDQLAGTIDLKPDGYLDLFYCHPNQQGRGIGQNLYARLEKIAISSGLGRISTHASEAARRFFLNNGFAVTARREFQIGGVMIHNFAMEKRI